MCSINMSPKELLMVACLGLLGGLTSTTTTTTFVAAMSIANPDLERYFRTANNSQTLTTMSMVEDRIAMDVYTYAFLNYSYYAPNPIEVSFNEEKARYGEGKIMTIKGKLVHVSDVDDTKDDTACGPNVLGTRGVPTPTPGLAWVALVRRGRCTFEEKVKNVHAKGATGVIIYNDKPVMNLEKMQIKGKNRNITAVITYQEIGLNMAHLVDQGVEVTVAIIEGRSGMRPINSLNRTSVLFVSISFIVLMIISLVWLVFYYIQRFRYLQNKDQQSRHLCSVTKKAIMKIPTKTGKTSDEKDIDSDCCAICIEAYKPSDCIRVLPCKHEFHKSCIDPWLIEHRTCPMCKLDVLKFYGYVFLGSEESILEYEADRQTTGENVANLSAPSAHRRLSQIAGARGGSALVDLIRSRDFVIDFPRIFVLDGGTTGTRETLFPSRLPERSQSSMSLTYAKDWMSVMTNKLEEQHGLRRIRKSSAQCDMHEHLLAISDSGRKRRSRSADGRYSSGYFGRKELLAKQQQQITYRATTDTENATNETIGGSRRNSAAIRGLTEASYAQSKQRIQQECQQTDSNARRRSLRRDNAIQLGELPTSNNPPTSTVLSRRTSSSRENTPPMDVSITIQVNGEGVDLE